MKIGTKLQHKQRPEITAEVVATPTWSTSVWAILFKDGEPLFEGEALPLCNLETYEPKKP